VTDKPFRILPRLGGATEFFWTSGADGQLRFIRCQRCGYYVHPPSPICPVDLSKDLAPERVSGRGTVHTFTVNHQPWIPGYEPPYAVAIVELEEQEGLRLMTNVVGCPPEEVRIGMPVRVTFEHHDDVWLPLFTPA
jgi:uncharacterized OB-fold protein